MIDNVFINISSGNGGDGAVSGRREKFVPRGGPDGGDGGNGGSVIAVCDPNINTLLAFRYKRNFPAPNGGGGASALKHGADGADIRINVPVGTQIWDADANPPQLLADLAAESQTATLARGGRGGRGNAYFASPTNQFPLLTEQGEPGETLRLRLELKLLADLGIIGLPNAGKSSLLSVVSAARPKIANYPFTTLEPALGVVERHRKTFVMVDIPGLIEGAHQGVGLGHDFLRHIERTRALVHMIDGSTPDPLDDYRKINAELRLFNADLAAKPQIVAINKTDITEVRARIPELESAFAAESVRPLFISAATHSGLAPLLDAALAALDAAPAIPAAPAATQSQLQPADSDADTTPASEIPILRPQPRRRRPAELVVKRNGAFIVQSQRAVRIAALLQDDWNARMQFIGYLQRAGVTRALEDAGVAPGDTVRFGDVEWEWQ